MGIDGLKTMVDSSWMCDFRLRLVPVDMETQECGSSSNPLPATGNIGRWDRAHRGPLFEDIRWLF